MIVSRKLARIWMIIWLSLFPLMLLIVTPLFFIPFILGFLLTILSYAFRCPICKYPNRMDVINFHAYNVVKWSSKADASCSSCKRKFKFDDE